MKLPRAHHLSSEILAGQVLMPAIQVQFLNRSAPGARKILQWLQRYHVGGLFLFGGHPADIRFWTKYWQQESQYPLMFAADLEGGLGNVFGQGTHFPHALTFGAADDDSFITGLAEVVAKEARSIGINVCFAPVVNLATNPAHPFINIHAYHSSVDKVTHWGKLFTQMVEKSGIACVAKHFPGDMPLSDNPQLDLPQLPKAIEELSRKELIPFQQLIEENVKGLMVGHLMISGSELPASMDASLVEGVLRNQWHYHGVVFSDGLNKKAIQKKFPTRELLIRPLEAGVDILLMPPQIPLAHQILVENIEKDEAFRYRVEQAVERIFRLKKWLHAHQPEQTHPFRIYKMLQHPNHIGLAAKVAEKGITLVHTSESFPLNLPEFKRVQHLIFTNYEISEQPLKYFCDDLKQIFDEVIILNNPTPEMIPQLGRERENLRIISLNISTSAKNPQELDWAVVQNIIQGESGTSTPLVIFLFGDPSQLKHVSSQTSMDALFLTYSDVEACQHAAVKALCSFIPIQGKLPVPLPEPLKREVLLPAVDYRLKPVEKATLPPEISAQIQEAISKHIFPGCVLIASKNGIIQIHQAFGRYTYDPQSREVTPDTVYDLASLTKVLATTPAIMKLIEAGELSLSQKLSDFYPTRNHPDKAQITISNLLSHQSGLPAWQPLYKDVPMDEALQEKRRVVVQKILNTPLEYPPGTRTLYSDLGFILLWDIIIRITGISFGTFCRQHLFQPLGLSSLTFTPPEKEKKYIPPTGYDAFRMHEVQGEVNDTNCFVLGGECGHAGLFGNARDVAAFGQLFIQKGIYNRRRLFRRSTIDLFIQGVDHKSSQPAMGWDTPEKGGAAGNLFSSNSIGHLGFTGTSLWIDLDQEIVIALLSNRTHPDPKKNRMDEIRPKVHDLVMKYLLKK